MALLPSHPPGLIPDFAWTHAEIASTCELYPIALSATTPEMEAKLVEEMSKWVKDHNYIGMLNDCYDFTDHFQNRAVDLVQAQKVKNGEMGMLKHFGSSLWRHLLPGKHNKF